MEERPSAFGVGSGRHARTHSKIHNSPYYRENKGIRSRLLSLRRNQIHTSRQNRRMRPTIVSIRVYGLGKRPGVTE
jgi:hypothetical protein